VKISAAVPTGWKLNRRLFNCAMKPYLRKSKWLLHADGRLPYFSWWVNTPMQFVVLFYRYVARRVRPIKGNQGPWGDWYVALRRPKWFDMVQECKSSRILDELLRAKMDVSVALVTKGLPLFQRVNMMQLLYLNKDLGAK